MARAIPLYLTLMKWAFMAMFLVMERWLCNCCLSHVDWHVEWSFDLFSFVAWIKGIYKREMFSLS